MLFAILIVSCSKDDDSKSRKEYGNIIRTWTDTGETNEFHFVLYELSLEEDSFRLKSEHCNDMMMIGCPMLICWENYSTGQYFLQGDALMLQGIYCDSTYTTETLISPCPPRIGIGDYQYNFKYTLKGTWLKLEQPVYPFEVVMERK